MVEYATNSPVSVIDEPFLDELIDYSKQNGYGFIFPMIHTLTGHGKDHDEHEMFFWAQSMIGFFSTIPELGLLVNDPDYRERTMKQYWTDFLPSFRNHILEQKQKSE